MISAAALHRYLHVLDASDAPRLLAAALRGGRAGRPSNVHDAGLYLLGGLIATDVEGQATIAAIVRALMTQLARSEQRELGIPLDEEGQRTFTARLYAINKKITHKLNYGDWLTREPAPTEPKHKPIDADEVTRRRDQLQTFIDAVLGATVLDMEQGSFALDASGIHSWGRYSGPARLGEEIERDDEEPDPDHQGPAPDVAAVNEAAEVAQAEPNPAEQRRRRGKRDDSYDPEAATGGKTNKRGRNERFYGYHLHALTRVCETRNGIRQSPLAIQSFTVTPANADVVAPSLMLLDNTMAAGTRITKLAVDRHYSFKRWDRWRRELRIRGIKPTHDLRSTDHGFSDYDSMKLAAGWPHCPATPDHLARIERPGFAATREDWRDFAARIEERRAYAMRRVNDHDANGRTRWQCPALAGSCGCTLREGTVAAVQQATREATDRGDRILIPIVTTGAAHQPDGARLRPCSQTTVSIPDGDHMKMYQEHYWGSPEWEADWNLRTFVEAWFGVAKNPTVAGMDRHFYRGIGTAHVSLAVLFAAVVTNIHLLRTWHAETELGPADHPLLHPDEDNHGFERLDAGRAAHVDRAHALRALTAPEAA